jgi:hypothetical protein
MKYDIGPILRKLTKVKRCQTHDETVDEIEKIFRDFGFFTTREYPIFRMKDGSGRKGRIDLVARKGKFRVALEYDHKRRVKYKSFQKIIQIKPEIAIAITGLGYLNESLKRAEKYKMKLPLYVISLKEELHKLVVIQKDFCPKFSRF